MAEIAVKATKLGKRYRLYDRPGDRLREILTFGGVHHKAFWALEDFELEVHRGEAVGIVGVNGAGKSTLLKLLAGKLRPTTGEITMNGKISSILELGTGFHPHLTGRQNARVNALFLGQRPWDLERHVDKILDFAGIGEHADQPLSTYSSGMQSRLAFAALTTLDPEILILDEALATGDGKFVAKCNEFLRALCRSGCTTLVASHDLGFLANTCDRVVWIEKGKKRGDGSPSEVLQGYLDALGQHATVTATRPANVLVKIEAAEPEAHPAFVIDHFMWLDGEEHLLGEQHVGDQEKWHGLIELAPKLGFTPEGAQAGWGKAEMARKTLSRSCTPTAGPQGVAYVALPVPAPPRPVPTKLRVTLGATEACDAIFSLLIDGTFHEIGRAGGTRPGVEYWTRIDMDVAPLFQRSKAAIAPGGVAS